MALKKGEPRTKNIARIGGYAVQARHDTSEWREKGNAKLMSSFERKVDPEGLLSPEERERRTAAARSEHFARLSYRSAESRRRRQ
ncbi:MAG: hypothetical protein WD557_01300 [Dehalococcoidia bacterium]